jgi:hypothetical protein
MLILQSRMNYLHYIPGILTMHIHNHRHENICKSTTHENKSKDDFSGITPPRRDGEMNVGTSAFYD